MIDNFLRELFDDQGGMSADDVMRMGGAGPQAPDFPDTSAFLPPLSPFDQMVRNAGGPDAVARMAGKPALPSPVPMPTAAPSMNPIPMPRAPARVSPLATPDDGDMLPLNARFATGPADVPGGPTPQDRMAGTAKPQQPDQSTFLGRMVGRRALGALAAGMKGANPAFKGGAFMAGLSGGLSGGLASDKEDRENARQDEQDEEKRQDRAANLGIKRETLEDRKKTSAVLRDLYGARAKNVGTTGTGRAAWNKPPHERYKDATKLIQDQEKLLRGRIPITGTKADRDAARAKAEDELKKFRSNTYKQYGIDEEGNETSPYQPESKAPQNGASARPGGGKNLTGTGTKDDPYTPETQEDFDALPGGTWFINPANDKPMRKRVSDAGLETDEMVT